MPPLPLGCATYILPIRSRDPADDGDLTGYLRRLATQLDVIVVDGSPPDVAAAHRRAWGESVLHIRASSYTRNGKVGGVLDGVAAATTPYVVIADDDVRYDEGSLRAVVSRLDACDAVIPQNYFQPAPWHARWDTARTLVNRAFGFDYAGTVGLRREAVATTGGYCGAVLFENLELLRTLVAGGFSVCHAPDIFVVRRPPSLRHFAGQRVRQAYDSHAQPARLAAELLVLPALTLALRRRRSAFVAMLASTVGVAEAGRRRSSGRSVFGVDAALWAPAWVVERGVCAWLALGSRACGGVRYADGRLVMAAHSRGALARQGCAERICSCGTPWRQPGEAVDDSRST